jgi:hypothetical protein
LKYSRIIHIFSLLVTLLGLGYTIVTQKELWTGNVAIFATISGFVTVYGVAFAIIETWRARNASELARSAAFDARDRMGALYNVKNIGECQAGIRNALSDLDKDGWVSTASLSRILELYTAEFFDAYDNPHSEQRKSIAMLQSHAASASGPLKGQAVRRLKDTLVKMLTDLTAKAAVKMSETII